MLQGFLAKAKPEASPRRSCPPSQSIENVSSWASLRKHVPDSDPGWAPPKTLILPNHEFTADSGRRKCSAGACPQLRIPVQPARESRHARSGARPLFPDLVIPAPQFVIPAKAGIQRGGAGCGNDARWRACVPCDSPTNQCTRFSHLGVPAPAGMSDCYENRLPRLISSSGEGRNPGVGRGECSAGACPPLGRRRGVAESAVPIRRTKPQLRLSIPWCAGASRYERLL